MYMTTEFKLTMKLPVKLSSKEQDARIHSDSHQAVKLLMLAVQTSTGGVMKVHAGGVTQNFRDVNHLMELYRRHGAFTLSYVAL